MVLCMSVCVCVYRNVFLGWNNVSQSERGKLRCCDFGLQSIRQLLLITALCTVCCVCGDVIVQGMSSHYNARVCAAEPVASALGHCHRSVLCCCICNAWHAWHAWMNVSADCTTRFSTMRMNVTCYTAYVCVVCARTR